MILDSIKQKEFRLMEIILVAKKVFTENFKAFFMVTLALYLPIAVVETLLGVYISNILSAVDLNAIMESPYEVQKLINSTSWEQLTFYISISLMLQFLVAPIFQAACMKVTEDACYGKKPVFMEGIAFAFSKTAPILLSSVMFSFAVLFGVFLFLIPGILLGCYWFFYVNAIVLSDKGPLSALSQSAALVKNNLLRTFGTIAFFYICTLLFGSVVDFFLSWGYNNYFIVVAALICQVFIQVFFFVASAIWYMNRDWYLKQGYKIDMVI